MSAAKNGARSADASTHPLPDQVGGSEFNGSSVARGPMMRRARLPGRDGDKTGDHDSY